MNKGPMFDGVWSHPVLLDLVASALPDFKLFSLNGAKPKQGFRGQDAEGNTMMPCTAIRWLCRRRCASQG